MPLNKENYTGIDGLLPGIGTWVDSISQYQIVDITGDGLKEIIAIQRVIGVAHVDIIGILRITYEMIGGNYRPVKQSLYDQGENLLRDISL